VGNFAKNFVALKEVLFDTQWSTVVVVLRHSSENCDRVAAAEDYV
jgi:hypothetical protein